MLPTSASQQSFDDYDRYSTGSGMGGEFGAVLPGTFALWFV